MEMKCRVYKIEGGIEDENYSYLTFIPSHQPKERDDFFIPRSYKCPDGTYLGEWEFDENFLKHLDIIERPRLKLTAYNG